MVGWKGRVLLLLVLLVRLSVCYVNLSSCQYDDLSFHFWLRAPIAFTGPPRLSTELRML